MDLYGEETILVPRELFEAEEKMGAFGKKQGMSHAVSDYSNNKIKISFPVCVDGRIVRDK